MDKERLIIYVKVLKDNSVFENIEKTYNIEIPKYLKEIISKYNGGRPEKRLFDTQNGKKRILQGLISFNKEDRASISIYEDFLREGYIPFAITEFGDVICIKIDNGFIELYLHELDKFEYVCDNIEKFFNILYN